MTRQELTQQGDDMLQPPQLPIRIGTCAADTLRLLAQLRQMNPPIGTLIPYAALAEMAGRDLPQLRHILMTVRKRLADERQYYQCVPTKGLLRVGDAEKVKEATASRHRAAKAARRVRRSLKTIRLDMLSAEEGVRHLAELSILGVVESFGREQIMEHFRGMAGVHSRALNLRECAEALRDILRDGSSQ